MFLAYDKVAHTQYEFYMEYAERTPGVATRSLAQDILYAGWNHDPELKDLNTELRSFSNNSETYPCEYSLFAIRSADGDTLDIYFLDEDSLFLAVETAVSWADASFVAKKISANWKNYSSQR